MLTMDPLSIRNENNLVGDGRNCSSNGVKQPLEYGKVPLLPVSVIVRFNIVRPVGDCI